jgi:hypothetical protein
MSYSKRVISKTSPCEECQHKYKCEEKRLACSQFRYFVNTGAISEAISRMPTRKIYVDIFYTELQMHRKETICE